MENILEERWELARGRVQEIIREAGEGMAGREPWRDYFVRTARFLLLAAETGAGWKELTFEEKKKKNAMLYEDILPGHYSHSYGNPAYAVKCLGDYGRYLSFLYSELRGMIVYSMEGRLWDMTVCCELFLEVYGAFSREELPKPKEIRDILYWYVSDYCEDMVERRIKEQLDPSCSFAEKILMEADLGTPEYLYDFGEYITDSECRTAQFLGSLSQEEIDRMARTYTEGYRMGFINGNKDLSKKKTVNIRYCLGFERVVRVAVGQFRCMGLQPVVYRAAVHVVNKKQHHRIGYYGHIPNQQFDYDHRGDAALFLDEDFIQRRLRAAQTAYEKYKELADVHGGPAVMEIFGETPFTPQNQPEALALSESQQKLQVYMDNQLSQITNRYIKGEERSFTIIAWPVPEIGGQFPEIFREVVRINTLDAKVYEQIQQRIIQALDQGDQVHIQGKGTNRTDLTVALHPIQDRDSQTAFENCVADVNIPVGEVFTSPRLKGTNGVLHVSQVYLNGLLYKDLELVFQDGMVTDYRCGNFPVEEENKKYIRENVLYHHESLPMGEFAIGTNTTAYMAARKYQIEAKLPILIAEKMGPHFAVGDTCYSWSEDVVVKNPDGREVIARDNEVSRLRFQDKDKAYMGCHTDITIPYDELGHIQVMTPNGTVKILEDGRFVLPGTEELNEPLLAG